VYLLIFLAPHNQNRPSITAIGPTRAGLFLESFAIFLAFACRLPPAPSTELWRIAVAAICGIFATILSWTAVRHLGRQFRVHAGLYEDHELVTSGPYGVVRHPIYTSLLAMLVCSLLILTSSGSVPRLPSRFLLSGRDSRPHRGPPAGIAFRRAFLSSTANAFGPTCHLCDSDLICSGAFCISLAFLVAGGTSFGADLTGQYRATADKLYRCCAGRYRRLRNGWPISAIALAIA
jgi:hypothetical protein